MVGPLREQVLHSLLEQDHFALSLLQQLQRPLGDPGPLLLELQAFIQRNARKAQTADDLLQPFHTGFKSHIFYSFFRICALALPSAKVSSRRSPS